MLQKLDLGNENVVAFRWEGKFDEKAFKQSLVQFLPELQSRYKMNIYIEITDIDGVEAKALYEDIKFSFKNLNELREKIEKVAIVTDKDWIRNLSETSSKFIPGIKLKAFTFDEAGTALMYVNE